MPIPATNNNGPVNTGIDNSQENINNHNAGTQQSIDQTNAMSANSSELSQANLNRGIVDMMNAANMAAVESMGMIF